MYLFVAEILTKPGAEARYEAILREVVHALALEPCFVHFSISRSVGDPRMFLLHEIWTSRAEYERLRDGPVFRDYLSARKELVEMISRRDWALVEHVSRPTGAV
ncbi:MAG: putative quinol monooxygenase [Rhizobiaceae bacterium]|jgi:quinol monooxygenase YgiN